MTIRFDDAWSETLRLAEQVAATGTDVVLGRDLVGRVLLVLDMEHDVSYLQQVAEKVTRAAGSFAGTTPVLTRQDLFSEQTVLNSPDLVVLRERSATNGRLAILERTTVGADWVRTGDAADPPRSAGNRVTLYGFKGGVGRSTAEKTT